MKKAYFSFMAICIIPFFALTLVMGSLAKNNPNYEMLTPGVFFPAFGTLIDTAPAHAIKN
jgi:hypothetical protein